MKIQHDCNLAPFLWYKIGGAAKYVLEIASKNDVLEAVTFVQDKHIKNILVIGLGSNLLFAKDYFDGAVLRFVSTDSSSSSEEQSDESRSSRLCSNNKELIDEIYIDAFAGETLDEVIQFGFTNNLIGLEWAGGLPGTIGAAVRGNVGAFGGEIKDVVGLVEVIDLDYSSSEAKAESRSKIDHSSRQARTVNNQDLEFAYRSSKIKHNKDLIISSVVFKLKKATDEELQKAKAIYRENIAYREKNHPLDFPNCGSVFKNIHSKEHVQKILRVYPDIQDLVQKKWHGKVSMAYLINRLGFSGYRVGSAQVSEKHANFIINMGNAKAKDVLEIIESIQKKFLETFGFTPEVEVEIV